MSEVATTLAPETGTPIPTPATAPIKRGRGRPRKDGSAPRSTKAKTRTVRESPHAAVPRRVPIAAASTEAPTLDAVAIARQLSGLHAVGAFVAHCPDIALDDAEALEFAHSVELVLHEYSIPMSGKLIALLGLFGTAAAIYIPRIILIRKRIETARSDQARTINVPPRHEPAPEPGAFVHEAARA